MMMKQFSVDEPAIASYTFSNERPSLPMLSAIPNTTTGANLSVRFSPTAIRLWKGGNRMNAMKSFKIGCIRVKPDGRDSWIIRYHDPASGRDVRRKLSGLGLKEVHAVAGHVNHEVLSKGGYLPGEAPAVPGVSEGMTQAIESRNTIPATRRDRMQRAKAFVAWLGANHPSVKTWDQLKPAMVQNYVVASERRGLAFCSVRLNLAPIKLAWRYMAENYSDHVRPLPRIKVNRSPKPEIQCLEAPEVAALLDWLRLNAPDLWVMGTLQALCGLRVLEACNLRVEDVDLENETLTITDTGRHKPKTLTSWRTIPLCSDALTALRHAIASQKIRPATGELFLNADGGLWKQSALGHRWTKTLRRAARATDNPRLAEVPAKGLRRSFATLAGKLGVQDRLLKAYLGHAPGDMLGEHYRRIDVAELKTVSGAMESWKEALGMRKTGNFLASAPQRESANA